MLPKWHILFGLIFSSLIYFFGIATITQTTIVFLASILIDLDHYFRFVIIKGDFSPKNFWKWSMEKRKKWLSMSIVERRKKKYPLYIFHSIEFLLLTFILTIFYFPLIYLLIGFLFHLIFDYVDMIKKSGHFLNKFSLLILLKRNKKRENFD